MKTIKAFLIWILSFFPAKTGPKSIIHEFRGPKEKPPEIGKTPLVPMEGNDWNPMLKYPRNETCYCGSRKKYKKCCFGTEALAIPKEVAIAAAPLIAKLRKK